MGKLLKILHRYSTLDPIPARGVIARTRARDERLEDEVFIEREPFTRQPETFLPQYRSVLLKLMRLRSPNVVGIRDFHIGTKGLSVVKVPIPDRSLSDVLVDPQVPWASRERFALDIAQGLAELHRVGIVHRDLRASSIAISDRPEPRALIDGFELAVSTVGAFIDLGLYGDPAVLAPEVIDSPHLYTRRSDVYAAGLLLFELLSGRRVARLLEEEQRVTTTRARVVLKGGDLSESQIRGEVPERFADAIVRATRGAPSERFANGVELRDALLEQAPIRPEPDPNSPEQVAALIDALQPSNWRTELLDCQGAILLDARGALNKAREIGNTHARKVYRELLGSVRNKSMIRIAYELHEQGHISIDLFTELCNLRREGSSHMAEDEESSSEFRPEVISAVLGAAARITAWLDAWQQQHGG